MAWREFYSSNEEIYFFSRFIFFSFNSNCSPGIHYLRDYRTNVYNFDPILRNITQPEDFNLNSIPKFIPATEDKNLHENAGKLDCKIVSSTSSISASLSHFFYLINGVKPFNMMSNFTTAF